MPKLQISPKAKEDMAEIKTYISEELSNPEAAINVLKNIAKRIRELQSTPQMGAPLSSIIDVKTNYRFLVCGNYLVFYLYETQTIYVTRVLYNRRDYVRILFSETE